MNPNDLKPWRYSNVQGRSHFGTDLSISILGSEYAGRIVLTHIEFQDFHIQRRGIERGAFVTFSY